MLLVFFVRIGFGCLFGGFVGICVCCVLCLVSWFVLGWILLIRFAPFGVCLIVLVVCWLGVFWVGRLVVL